MRSGSGTKRHNNSSSSGSTNNVITGSKTTPCCSKMGLKRGPWTAEEDGMLASYIRREGEGRWRTLPKRAGLLRCGKSCRLRWMNYLRPSVKRGHIAPDEEDLILRLHRLLGNRWSLIAGRIPGRTDNEIKNYWNTHLSKKLISQGIDPKTHKPLIRNPNSSVAATIITATAALPYQHINNLQPSPSLPNYPLIMQNPTIMTDLPLKLLWEESPSVGGGGRGDAGTNSQFLVDIPNANAHTKSGFDRYKNVNYGNAAKFSGVGEDEKEEEEEEDEDDSKRCCWNGNADDAFSSFLNSLINEDALAAGQQPILPNNNNNNNNNNTAEDAHLGGVNSCSNNDVLNESYTAAAEAFGIELG